MRLCLVIVVLGLLAGCGGGSPQAPPTTLPRVSIGDRALPTHPSTPATTAAPAPPGPAATTTAPASRGWEITVYYTAVQRFHDGAPERVTGCRGLDCTDGDEDLGEYPAGLVAAVKDEGTGLTADGRYLNWSYDVGYWLGSAAGGTSTSTSARRPGRASPTRRGT